MLRAGGAGEDRAQGGIVDSRQALASRDGVDTSSEVQAMFGAGAEFGPAALIATIEQAARPRPLERAATAP